MSGARKRNVGWRIDYFYVTAGPDAISLQRVDHAGRHGVGSLPDWDRGGGEELRNVLMNLINR